MMVVRKRTSIYEKNFSPRREDKRDKNFSPRRDDKRDIPLVNDGIKD
jgi:hypothetical protein